MVEKALKDALRGKVNIGQDDVVKVTLNESDKSTLQDLYESRME